MSGFSDTFLAEATAILDAGDRTATERMALALARVRHSGGRLFILGVGGSAALAMPSTTSARSAGLRPTRRPTTSRAAGHAGGSRHQDQRHRSSHSRSGEGSDRRSGGRLAGLRLRLRGPHRRQRQGSHSHHARVTGDHAPPPNLELIWASPRELLNVVQADAIGCHIITVSHDLLKKLPLLGRDLDEFSLDTVRMFLRDADKAGYVL